jgi:hypothetical protein
MLVDVLILYVRVVDLESVVVNLVQQEQQEQQEQLVLLHFLQIKM